MLKSLASYLLGGETETCNTAGLQDNDKSIKSVEADDDWILVEVAEPRNEKQQTSASSPSSRDHSPHSPSQRKGDLTLSVTVAFPSDSPTSPLSPLPMEGSWFVTPPPCFTAQYPKVMETSPMENLLIEHPSQSVYMSSSTSRLMEDSGSESATDMVVVKKCTPRRSKTKQTEKLKSPKKDSLNKGTNGTSEPVVEAPKRQDDGAKKRGKCPYKVYNNPAQKVVSIASALLPNHAEELNSRKSILQQHRYELRPKQLQRSNLTREVASQGGQRPRRSNLIRHHSGMNNNRKCY